MQVNPLPCLPQLKRLGPKALWLLDCVSKFSFSVLTKNCSGHGIPERVRVTSTLSYLTTDEKFY